MKVELEHFLEFPEDALKETTELFFPSENQFVSGYCNRIIFFWNLSKINGMLLKYRSMHEFNGF